MANYKKSLGVGIKFESKTDVTKKLTTLLKGIDKKIDVDLNIKTDKSLTNSKKSLSDIAKSVDQINTKMAELSKIKLNIFNKSAINNINKINDALEKATKLKSELESDSNTNTSSISKKIKQEQEYLELLKKESAVDEDKTSGNDSARVNILKQEQKALENLKIASKDVFKIDDSNIENSIDKITNKIKELYEISGKQISLSSFINQLNESNEIVTSLASKIKTLGSKSGLEISDEKAFKQANEYVNVIKQAYNETLKQIKAQDDLNTKLNNTEFTDAQKDAYSTLNKLLIEEYNIKKQLLNADEKTVDVLNEQLIANKLNQKTTQDSIKTNNYTSLQKENELIQKRIDLENQLNLAKAKNNDNIASKIEKETQAYKKEQQQVQELIEKTVRLLEVKKQSLTRQYGNKIDTSNIDEAIGKLKQMDNVSLSELRSEISKINVGIAEATETAKSSTGIFSNMVSSLRNIGVYIDLGDVIRGVVNEIKSAVDYVVEVENSMIDLRRVVDMSDESANKFQSDMHELSLTLASSNADTISSVATFKKLGYTLEESTKLGEIATKYNFAADINNMDEATSGLIATLKGFNLEASNAESVTNKINEVSNNYAVTAGDINEALRQSSASLYTFGNGLDEAIAMNTAIVEVTRNASQAGNALKSISSRLTTNSNALKVLNQMNISIEDQNGNLKSTYQLFKEIADQLKNLKGEELASATNNLFGKQNMSSALALIQNMEKAEEVLETTKNSVGSVDQEFDRYLNSTTAKVAQLKESMGGLYSQFINSDMTKGVVDGLNVVVTGVTSLISKLGAVPTVIATVVGSLTALNSKFREMTSSYQPAKLTEFIGKLNGLSSVYKSQIVTINENIVAQKTQIATQNQTGLAFVTSRAKLLGYQAQLGLATVAENACAIGAKALGVAFNMALGAGIGFAIQAIMEFANASEIAKQKNEALLSSIQQTKSDINTMSELQSQFESISESLRSGALTDDEAVQKKKDLKGVYDQLIQACPQLEGALDLENGKYEENIELIKQAIGLKQEQLKLDTQKYITDNDVNTEGIEKKIEKIKELEESIESFSKKSMMSDKELKANGDLAFNFLGLGESGDSRRKYFEQLKNDTKQELLDLQNEIQTDLSKINSASELGIKLNVDSTTIDNAKSALEKLNEKFVQSSDSTEQANSKADEYQRTLEALQESSDELSDSSQDNANAIAQAKEQYSKCSQEIGKAQNFVQKLNKEQTVTPTLLTQISKAYPEIGSAVNDVSSCVEFLNGKIREQQAVQQQAYEQMIGDDEAFYQEKMANNSEFQQAYNNFLNSWLADGENSYNIDLSNYKSLNDLKAQTQDGLGQAIENWLTQFVGSSANGYAQDFANFKSFAQAKADILNKLNAQLKIIEGNIQANVNKIQQLGSMDANTGGQQAEQEKLYSKNIGKLDALNEAIKEVDTNFDGINGAIQGFSGGGISTGGGSVGSGKKSGGSGGSKGKSDAEKAEEERIKNMEKLLELNDKLNNEYDRYFDLNNAYDEVNNQLSYQEQLVEGLTGSDKISAEQKVLELKQKQAEALKALNDEREREANEIGVLLQEQGFEIDSNGKLINSQKRLAELQEELKHKTYEQSEAGVEAKEKDIEELESLKKKTEEYIDLTNKQIPQAKQQYLELANAIKQAKEEQIQALREDLVSGLQKEYEKAKELEEQANEDWYTQRKENLEKEYQSDLESLQDEKQSIVDEYDEEIEKLQKQLDALNDDTDDKQAKLAGLKAELALWQKDDSVNIFLRNKLIDINTPYVQKCA